ncbi:MAG: zinc ribbon domain-containing protein [Chitinispirillaceae bacterium]|nr:zinc ribbon domain-containing protein [Chitinispirillaceae bacterium]
MPLYEYECEECGAKFEELMPVGSTENPPCAECSSLKTHRTISVVAGFYGAKTSCSSGSGFS